MRKIPFWILLFITLLVSSCTRNIKVNVNTYKLDNLSGKVFCIFNDNKNIDPLNAKIGSNIKKFIKSQGYKVADNCTIADYVLFYKFIVTDRKFTYTDLMPILSSNWFSGNINGDTNIYFSGQNYNNYYVPIQRSKIIFSYNLVSSIIDIKKTQIYKKPYLVWQGFYSIYSENYKPRVMANYLLETFKKFFLKDTGKNIQYQITPKEKKQHDFFKNLINSLKTKS